MPVEILLVDDIGDVVPGAIIEHQATNHRLLRLQRVWRDLEVVDTLAELCHAGGYFRHNMAFGNIDMGR